MEYNPYKVLSYGACKIDGEYHVLMTVGLAIKSRDGVNWQKYEAFKVRNVRMQGDPDLISCGAEPSFFSRDYGLYYYSEHEWLKRRGSKSTPYSFNENNDRRIMVFYKEPRSLYISSQKGWEQPEELNDYREKGYAISYYDKNNIIFGRYTDKVEKVIQKINGSMLTKEASNKISGNLDKSPFRVVKLKDKLFVYNVTLDSGAIQIDEENLAKTIPIDVIKDADIGMDFLKCVDVRDDLSACNLYPSGVAFISMIEDRLVFYKMGIPKNAIESKPNVVFGRNEIIFEASGPYETDDKELLLAGTITEYSYDSIVKFMSKRSN